MSKNSRYGSLIQEARKQESQDAGKPESQNDSMPEVVDEDVNLSIRVPKSLRRHWVAEAKRHDTSITAVVTEALKARFGEPG